MVDIDNNIFIFDNFLSPFDFERIKKWTSSQKTPFDRSKRSWQKELVLDYKEVYMGETFGFGGMSHDRMSSKQVNDAFEMFHQFGP